MFGHLQARVSFSNSGTINVIGDTSGVGNRALFQFNFGTDYTNECNGIINLIGGNQHRNGWLLIARSGGSDPIFNNFGTITGTNSNIPNQIGVILLDGAPITVNNHGTLTAPVLVGQGIFNDNLPDQCSSSIPVEAAAQNVIDNLQDIIDVDPDIPSADKLGDGVAKLDTVLEELNKDPPDNQAAVGNIEGAIGDIQAAVDSGDLDTATGNDLMDQLAGIAEQLASDAIDAAIADPESDSDKISEAEASLGEGDDLRDSKDYKDAANKYKDALAQAEGALP